MIYELNCVFLLQKDQLKLIFELCGTPDETNWPGANDIDSYGLLGSLTACKRRVREVFREFDTEALDLLDKMLVLNPTKVNIKVYIKPLFHGISFFVFCFGAENFCRRCSV